MTHNIQRPGGPVQQRIQQFEQLSKTEDGSGVQDKTPPKLDPKKPGPGVPTDRQTEAKRGTDPQTPDLSQQAKSTQTGGLDRAPRGPRKQDSMSVQDTGGVGEGSGPRPMMQSALQGFRGSSETQRSEMEFKMRFPNLDLETSKYQIMGDMDAKPQLTRSNLRKAFENAGEPVPKDLSNVDLMGLSNQVVKEYMKLCPPDCGYTAKVLTGAFLGHPQGNETPQHTDALLKQKNGQLSPGSPIRHPDGSVSGVGPQDLSKVLRESTQPMVVQVSVRDNQGYGHAYVLEQLPRKSQQDPQLGFVHQSFIGTHSLSEWTKHSSPQPIDLKSQHLDKLPGFLDAPNGEQQLQVYRQLFLRPEDRLENEQGLRGQRRDVQIVFTATPYDPMQAPKTLSERMSLG
jgi:hypothetical protein